MSPFVWYNRGMNQMSDFPDLRKWGRPNRDCRRGHYEGIKIIQGFPDITKASKKVRSFE
jgi:hypothetical protein